MLPNFLGIGTQRGATTWIYNCLKEHPEIFVPKIKEISFFDLHYNKGLSFYSSFFSDAKGYKLIGEYTPNYLYDAESPKRIANHLPHIKLIACLRNPVDRAFSEYQFFIRPRTGWSFEEALKTDVHILRKGLYCQQLDRYFSYFDKKQFLILLYHELIANDIQSVKTIYQFLNVNSDFCPSYLGKTVNTSSFRNLRIFLEKIHFGGITGLIKHTPFDFLLRKYLSRRNIKDKPAMKGVTRKKLIKYYEASNRKLEQLLNADLSQWDI